MSKIGAVLVRGMVGVRKDIKDTLKMLNLTRKNTLVISEDTPSILGMFQKCKDVITYGNISDETIEEIKKKRKNVQIRNKKILVFRLSPPKGGFERKGIKKHFKAGGALGLRRKGIDSLVKRMI